MSKEKLLKMLSRDQVLKSTGLAISKRNVENEFPLHWHDFFEIEIVTSGSGTQILNGKSVPLSKGSVSMLRPTDYHMVLPAKKLCLINLMVNESLIEERLLKSLVLKSGNLFFTLNDDSLMCVEQLCELCIKENGIPSPDLHYIKNILDCIMIQLIRALGIESHSLTKKDSTPIQRALTFLNLHFRENPSLEKAAGIAHYNASHFSTAFHKEVGMTYSEYLTMLKINYAKQLLLSTDLKISEICFECGFLSVSNFLRTFKTKVRTSPLKFRKTNISN